MLLLKLINLLLLITLTIVPINTYKTKDYCSKKLCTSAKHTACGYKGSFGPKCPKNAEVVKMTDELKAFIVGKHNEVRKGVCKGNYKGLKKANRMIEMVWNDELADLAECTAKTCVYAHDECRNTATYARVGQNIAMYSTKAVAAIKYKDICGGMIDSWLRQAKNCNMELVEQFRSDSGREKVDDFAQMIRAKCSQIGCALVYYMANSTKNVFLVCNYSSANEPKEPIYEVGPPCSACVAGCSFTCPGLCNTAEERYIINLKVNLLGLKLRLRL